MKKLFILVDMVFVFLAIASAAVFLLKRPQNNVSLVHAEVLNELDKKSVTTIDTSRLAAGMVPPTNKWFSGIALQKEPKTVFPTPFAFKPTDSGFSYGLTTVESTERSIIAGSRDIVSLTIADAKKYIITRYDELSVDLTYYNDRAEKLAVVTIAAGVPFIFISDARNGLSLASSVNFDSKGVYQQKNITYATSGTTAIGQKLNLTGKEATLYAAAKTDIASLAPFASHRIAGGSVAYKKQGTRYVTSLSYKTTGGDTVMGYLPHQGYEGKSLYSYNTIYGLQKFTSGSTFQFTTNDIALSDTLDLKGISDARRQELITLLRREINATEFKAVDTYYSGKELYRSAQLLQLAYQLDQPGVADTIRQKLFNEFQSWFAPYNGRKEKYFYYDTKTRTIVGSQASFGSEDNNDHHFHYGYFIYAASILAQHDKEFVKGYGDDIDMLVADIANYSEDESLPLRRSFDPYFGHSWASGSSPFDDGNNQESSSEAINAWVGAGLWAQIRRNDKLLEQSQWMLGQEVNAMQAYWLTGDSPVGAGSYSHSIFSLNWGGKRDYATFFSDEPAAKLGILLIPLNPTMQSGSVLIRNRIEGQIKAAGTNVNSEVYNFQDYMLMYQALNTADDSLIKQALEMNDTDIDGANSRSYMYAWIVSALLKEDKN